MNTVCYSYCRPVYLYYYYCGIGLTFDISSTLARSQIRVRRLGIVAATLARYTHRICALVSALRSLYDFMEFCFHTALLSVLKV